MRIAVLALLALAGLSNGARTFRRGQIRLSREESGKEGEVSPDDAMRLVEALGQAEAIEEGAPLDPEVEARMERATKGYWNYGTCIRRFPVAGMGGARWPLLTGTLQVQREFESDGEKVTYFDTRFAVLNSKFLSFFGSEDLARNCSKPEGFTPVEEFVNVLPLNSQFLKHLQAADESGNKCLTLSLTNMRSYTLCAETRHEKHRWIHSLRFKIRHNGAHEFFTAQSAPAINSRTMDELANSNTPHFSPANFFPAAPFSLTLRGRMGAALTGGVRPHLSPARWASASPVAAPATQQWSLDQVEGTKFVTICQKQEDGKGRCLTLDHFSNVSVPVPSAPEEGRACPGRNLAECFELDPEEEGGQTPEACAAKCTALGDDCGGWEFQKAGAFNNEDPRCCLKEQGFDGATCRVDECCTTYVRAFTHGEFRVVKSAFVDGTADAGVIRMLPRMGREQDENWEDQLWRVKPVGDRVAEIVFHEGGKCLTNIAHELPLSSGETSEVRLAACTGGVDQRWSFNGFEKPGPPVMQKVLRPRVVVEEAEEARASIPRATNSPIPVVTRGEPSEETSVLKEFARALKASPPEVQEEIMRASED